MSFLQELGMRSDDEFSSNDDESDMDVGEDDDDDDHDDTDTDDVDVDDGGDDGDDGDGGDDGDDGNDGSEVEIEGEFIELSRLHKHDCKMNEILMNQNILLKHFYDKIPADLNKVKGKKVDVEVAMDILEHMEEFHMSTVEGNDFIKFMKKILGKVLNADKSNERRK